VGKLMEAELIKIKVKQGLNKLDSGDYDNLHCWDIAEAINKAQLIWFRKQIHGSNLFREGDEQSKMRVDDLQVLLTTLNVHVLFDKGLYYEFKLPDDYLYFKRCSPIVSSDICDKVGIKASFIEEANVDSYLYNELKKPSFIWRETFHTIKDNTISIYTNKEFSVDSVTLVYYRLPKNIVFKDCQNYDGTYATEQTLEFKKDVVELIINEAINILSGNIEQYNAYSVSDKQNNEAN